MEIVVSKPEFTCMDISFKESLEEVEAGGGEDGRLLDLPLRSSEWEIIGALLMSLS